MRGLLKMGVIQCRVMSEISPHPHERKFTSAYSIFIQSQSIHSTAYQHQDVYYPNLLIKTIPAPRNQYLFSPHILCRHFFYTRNPSYRKSFVMFQSSYLSNHVFFICCFSLFLLSLFIFTHVQGSIIQKCHNTTLMPHFGAEYIVILSIIHAHRCCHFLPAVGKAVEVFLFFFLSPTHCFVFLFALVGGSDRIARLWFFHFLFTLCLRLSCGYPSRRAPLTFSSALVFASNAKYVCLFFRAIVLTSV